jgi:hypothetical protein
MDFFKQFQAPSKRDPSARTPRERLSARVEGERNAPTPMGTHNRGYKGMAISDSHRIPIADGDP